MKTISSLFIFPLCLLIIVQARDTRIAASAPPDPDSPLQGATNIPINTELEWDVQPGAITYRVQIAKDSLFSQIVTDTSVPPATGKAVGPLSYYTTYYWRVNDSDDGCSELCTSAWSIIFHFTTETSSAIIPQFSIQRLTLSTGSAIQFTIPQKTLVQIQLYDLKGELVNTLVNEVRDEGAYTISLDPVFSLNHYLLDFKAGNFHKVLML